MSDRSKLEICHGCPHYCACVNTAVNGSKVRCLWFMAVEEEVEYALDKVRNDCLGKVPGLTDDEIKAIIKQLALME